MGRPKLSENNCKFGCGLMFEKSGKGAVRKCRHHKECHLNRGIAPQNVSVTNNISNNQTINNTVVKLAFGKEDVSHISGSNDVTLVSLQFSVCSPMQAASGANDAPSLQLQSSVCSPVQASSPSNAHIRVDLQFSV